MELLFLQFLFFRLGLVCLTNFFCILANETWDYSDIEDLVGDLLCEIK